VGVERACALSWFDDGPKQWTKTIKKWGAAADFIKQHQNFAGSA